MNSNRYECQKFIEFEVGCSDPSTLKLYKDKIKNFILSEASVSNLQIASIADAKSLYYKAVLSFLEATYGIVNRHSSWAIVKLYYSTFYSLRVILLLSGNAIFKNGAGDIFVLKINENQVPKKVSTSSVRGDHKCTIKAFKDEFGDREILNTNTIDGSNVFDWIMGYRELVNYRINSFIEPDFGYDIIPNITDDVGKFDFLTRNYIQDQYYTYCFDENHSIYATPLVLIYRIVNKFKGLGIEGMLDRERVALIKQMIRRMGLGRSAVFEILFK